MRKLLIAAAILFSIQASSQSLMDSLSNSGFTMQDTVGEALVKLAMENPNIKVAEKQIEEGKYEWQINKASWLNNLVASFNMNELNINGTAVERNIYFPRYNFSFSLPMGSFFTKGKQTKKAKASYEEYKARRDVEVNSLREAVLVSYQNFQMNKYLLALQETVVQDASLLYSQAEDNFKKGQLSLELFTAASKQYNSELAKRVTLLNDVNVSKIQLESLIGMKYEEALKRIAPQAATPTDQRTQQ